MTDSLDRIVAITQRVRELLAREDGDSLRLYLDDLHGSDVADLIEALEPDQRVALVEFLPAELAADALAEMEDVEKPGELLIQLEPDRIGEIVEEMVEVAAARHRELGESLTPRGS